MSQELGSCKCGDAAMSKEGRQGPRPHGGYILASEEKQGNSKVGAL